MDRPTRVTRYLPELLAAAVTLLNAAKPVVVDDTAYLLHARHLAADPLHPYAFTLFWSAAPAPAMDVLLPPVVPGWLAVGATLAGEGVVLLKLWLFPFLWLFTRAVWYLLGVFAPGQRAAGSVLFAFSPAVLPLVNFMLDIPATACGLAATACLIHADRSGRLRWLVPAILFGGLAAQAKYTAIVLPAVWVWYGLTHRCLGRSAVVAAGGVALFAAWELWVLRQCGESHFVHHLTRQSASRLPADAHPFDRLYRWADVKGGLFVPLLSCLGGLASGWALVVAGRRRWVPAAAAAAFAGLLAVAVVPGSRQTLLLDAAGRELLSLPGVVFVGLGLVTLAATLVTCWKLTVGPGGRAGWFLAGWLTVEVASYFVLTPFPAARRVVMPTVLTGLVACAWLGRAGGRPHPAAVAYGLACGLGLFALDALDARAEHAALRRAVASVEPTPGRLWSQGHWGWQYSLDRAGGHLVVPGVSRLTRGDWLLLPLPAEAGDLFYRPYHGGAPVRLDESKLRFVRQIVVDDAVPCETIPTLYGGRYPFLPRGGPRVVVAIYRVTADWVPQPAPPP